MSKRTTLPLAGVTVRERPVARNAPPALSQHRDAILDELGYDGARRNGLLASGAVR